jgi:hypothetical protein
MTRLDWYGAGGGEESKGLIQFGESSPNQVETLSGSKGISPPLPCPQPFLLHCSPPIGVKMNLNVNFNRSTLTLTLRRLNFKIKSSGKKTMPKCFFVFLKLFIFNLFRLTFNFFNITSMGFLNIKNTCLQAPEQGLFYKVLQFTFVTKDIVTAQLSLSWE